MPTYGTYFRSAPRVNVLRGYFGQEPLALTRSAKPKVGEGILSGMVISLSGGEWVKGCAGGKTPFIAFQDQTDTDVKSSGLLLAFSCAGDYEIETAHFDNTQVYVDDSPLKAGVTTNLGKLTLGILGTDNVVGFCTRGGRQDVTAYNNQAAALAGPTGDKLYTLTFATHWTPHT